MRFAEATGLKASAIPGGRNEATAVGIEFEVEGGEHYRDAGQPLINAFDIKADGSLRGVAYEFVSRPISRAEAAVFVPAFCAAAREYGFTYSTRTSTHIHVNVRDLTCEAVALMVVGAAALECSLYRMCKLSRRINQFCVPLSQQVALAGFVSGMVHDLPQHNKRSAHTRGAKPTIGKYSAFSTHRLYDYGTLEYRVLHGTSNENEVLLMVDALLAIKAWAASTNVAEAADLLLRNYADIEDVVFGDDLARRIRAAALPGALPSGQKDCVDLARAALLACKMQETGGMQGPDNVAAADGTPAIPANIMEIVREYAGIPTIAPQMRRLLRSVQPGENRFGFTRRMDDSSLYDHTFLYSQENPQMTWVMTATYKIEPEVQADEVTFEMGE